LNQWIHGSSFAFPPLNSKVAGPEETKNLAGEDVLRLIQIRLATPSLEKSRPLGKQNSVVADRRYNFCVLSRA
jgi:hypothetical protein